MKTPSKSAKVTRLLGPSEVERKRRMMTYLSQTKPAFEEAVVKSRGLGASARGVLAGPILRRA